MNPPRTPGQRAGLSSQAVLATADQLFAERGLAGLTMRAVADRLGVAPNALYSHVTGKTGLIDGVLDHVLAAVEAPAPDVEDPIAGLYAVMTSTHQVLLGRPELVPHFLARQGARGPNARRLGDVMLVLLARAQVTGDAAQEALRALIVYTIGSAAFVAGLPWENEERPLPTGAVVRNFQAGLGWLLEGISAGADHRGMPVTRP